MTEKIESTFDAEISAKRTLRENLQAINAELVKLDAMEKEVKEKWTKQQMVVLQKTQEFDYNRKKINELATTIKGNTAALKTQLLPYNIDFKLENGNAIFKKLAAKRTQVETNQERLQVLNQAVGVLEKEVDLTEKSGKEKEVRLEKLAGEVTEEKAILEKIKTERTELFGTQNVEVERAKFEQNLDAKEAAMEAAKRQFAEVVLQLPSGRNQLKEIQKDLQEGEKLSAEIHAQVLEKLTAGGFENLATLKAAILEEAVAKKIKAHSEIIEK